ncbi:MAG: hypothetical protein B7Z74_02585, partial [Deltaproteobacteria bacterium 21-66-5]
SHSSLGSDLTKLAGNANLCQSCHNGTGPARDLAINTADKANLAAGSGFHHAWDVAAGNGGAGAGTPSNPEMAARLNAGQIVCSTCHNQHAAVAANGGTPRIAPAKRITALGSTGAVTPAGAFTGTSGTWYLVEIQTAGNLGAATFRWSKDNGTSWMGGNVLTAGSVALDNGVTVGFGAGSYAGGERWEFSASWPFLRAPLDSGDNATGAKFCRDCHAAWTMDHLQARTYTGSPLSHPVGVALGANGRGYDRGMPLDANGSPQGGAGADANPSNDVRLDATGRVQCFTCHGAHYAPGNSAAVAP